MKRNLAVSLVLLIIVAIAIGIVVGKIAKRTDLGIELSIVLYVLVIVGFVYWQIIRPSRLEKRLLASGEPAEASIEEAWETGIQYSAKKQIGLLLEVRPAGRSPFRGETRTLISRDQKSPFRPGDVVRARYDPQDTRFVAVEGFEPQELD